MKLTVFLQIFFVYFLSGQLLFSADDPLEFTKEKVASMKEILNKYKPEDPVRKQKIKEEALKIFDFTELGIRAIEGEKAKFSKEQLSQFTDKFPRMIEKLYLSRSEKFVGDNPLAFSGKKELSNNEFLVTATAKKKEADIKISVKLFKKNNLWMGYDIVVDETSLLATYSRQFKKIINKNGVEGLLKKIDSKLSAPEK